MQTYLKTLQSEFKSNSNPKIAAEQKAYMRNQFEYFGIKTPQRRELQKPFLSKDFLPKKPEAFQIIKTLWQKPERDYQLFAQELAFKYKKELEKEDIQLFEFMILNKSWWDTIDFIAPKLVNQYFKLFPKERDFYIEKWLESENMWLQRSAILFQLKDKENIDTYLLTSTITFLISSKTASKEFFINKAIGWILREYSRTNPNWVIDFVEKNETELSNLSKREALRLIKN
ncbi:DNA alkylation repair protein [Bernardetia sp. ABR2-2B]|uniref:DNA alkylation repair protein n=1 Tax=Bernardetia sp. ABR2-2B TaxID=3127472 RepID=UPI0030D0BFD7